MLPAGYPTLSSDCAAASTITSRVLPSTSREGTAPSPRRRRVCRSPHGARRPPTWRLGRSWRAAAPPPSVAAPRHRREAADSGNQDADLHLPLTERRAFEALAAPVRVLVCRCTAGEAKDRSIAPKRDGTEAASGLDGRSLTRQRYSHDVVSTSKERNRPRWNRRYAWPSGNTVQLGLHGCSLAPFWLEEVRVGPTDGCRTWCP